MLKIWLRICGKLGYKAFGPTEKTLASLRSKILLKHSMDEDEASPDSAKQDSLMGIL